MDYVTIFFTSGMCITRRVKDLFPLGNFTNSLMKPIPSGDEVLINWDCVACIRKATEYEIALVQHPDNSVQGVL